MQERSFRRITAGTVVVATTVWVASMALFICRILRIGNPSIAIAASAVMIMTILLQVVYVLVQGTISNGRTPVRVRFLGPDAWLMILLSTALPGVLWQPLGELALPPMRLVMPGYFTPLGVVLLLLIAVTLRPSRPVPPALGTEPRLP